MPEIRQIRVGGVTYDLVISEDEISATRARASEMSARTYSISAQSSKDSAAQSATASLQNYYNAIQEADRAEDAADRAEAIVGGQFVSYGQDQGLSDTYKAQARKNIDAEPFFIKITTSGISDDTHVVDKTSEEIVHAYEAGRTLVVIWERTFFNEIHTLYLSHKGISYGSGERGIGLDFTNPMSMNSAGLMTSYVWSFESLSNIWGLTKKFGIPLLYDPTTEEFPIEDAETFRAAISAGASNRNLLDNPFFTVNQRGFTSQTVSAATLCVDRWYIARCTASLSGNTISITKTSGQNNCYLSHHIDKTFTNGLVGKTVTLSAIIDGTLRALTGVVKSNGDFNGVVTSGITFALENHVAGYGEFVIYISDTAAHSISCVKLELGSYSTLSNDVPPNYAEELAKCKYYFERVKAAGNTVSLGIGYNDGYNTMYGVMKIEPKRVTPSLSGSSLLIGTTSLNTTSSSKSIYSFGSDGTAVIQIVATNAFSTNQPYRFGLPSNGYLDFSADL